MFAFLKRKFTNLPKEKEDKEKQSLNSQYDDIQKISSGFAITKSYRDSADNLAVKYEKPETYSGNRTAYDSGTAKKNLKIDAFKDNVEVTDPYTGNKLTLTNKEAKARYGKNWQNHVAESDHIVPLKKIHSRTKDSQWNTVEEIKDIANSKDNMEVISRKANNAKRDRTNEEFVQDDKYLEKKELDFSKKSKEDAVKRGKEAQKTINKKLSENTIKNIVQEGHKAGVSAGKDAGIAGGTVSIIVNTVSVLKGEKEAKQAIKDVVVDTGKAAAQGYVLGGGLTVASHSLAKSSSPFIQSLARSSVPGYIITGVMVTGNTIARFINGEISTQECMLELGEKGLTCATATYAGAIGQMVIPIPVVGAAVGALVGSMLTSHFYQSFIARLQQEELEHQERLRVIAECKELKENLIRYQSELNGYLESYFKEYQDCFDEAFLSISEALRCGDADGVIQGANMITAKMGGNVQYETMDEFEIFLNSNTVDVL